MNDDGDSAPPTAPTDAGDEWASSVVLGSGDTAYIRPLTPDDKAALKAFHERQSPESTYRRFFSPKPTLSEKDLTHFTEIDMVDRVALVVESQNEFVAWASYERWPGRNEAEAAFMVDDAYQGRGIATLLLEHLAAIATSNGIERFTAEVLGDNRAMLAVFSKAGWPLQRHFDSGVVDLDWDLASTDEFLDSVERREQRADSRAVARLLIPRSIAVVGASDRPGSVGHALWTHVINSVDIPAYPVNPRHGEVGGRHSYPSVDDLPDEVSLAIVAVPAAQLESTIDACITKRMRGAIIITDIEGSDVDIVGLVSRSRRHGLRIIGPSSMGAASLRADGQMQASLVDITLPLGHVAISLQSGSLGGSLLRRARDIGLGLSWFVSLGDKSDVSGNDLLQFWEDDEQTRVIAMYTESFGNPRKFARIARRVSHHKPIVAVRTGSAADGPMGSVLYKQAGLIEVPTVHALLDTARVLASQPVLRGPEVAVLTNSRSPATLASASLGVYELHPHVDQLPVDATADDFAQAIERALGSSDIDGVLVIHAPAVETDVDSATATAIDRAALDASKPVIAVSLGAADGPILPGSDVPSFAFPEQAAAALGRSHAYAVWLASEEQEAVPHHETPIRPDAAQQIIDDVLADTEPGAPVTADLASVSRLLGTYGIIVATSLSATPSTAVAAARQIGYPVAVKATRRSVGRSVKAGIALDLTEDDDVESSISEMQASLGDAADDLIVQAMTAPGFDVRIHCELDDRLGMIVSVGLGGAHADVIDDRASRLAPVSPSGAAAMLAESKVAGALADSGVSSEALIRTICMTALLASDQLDVTHVDLNPVIVTDTDAIVTDAAMTLVRHRHHDTPLRRLN